jgi:hypothetical protein
MKACSARALLVLSLLTVVTLGYLATAQAVNNNLKCDALKEKSALDLSDTNEPRSSQHDNGAHDSQTSWHPRVLQIATLLYLSSFTDEN